MEAIASSAAAHGQGWRQVAELLVAFGLSSVIGLERQLRGKSAGLRTQAIVGTAAALIMLVSKYGFGDVLGSGTVVLDPSRMAAQVVSGIGFLGAGLIITRRGAIRGLTTAAAVWETAAIGMAAGAGLPLLALVVTALHFVIVLGYTPLGQAIAERGHAEHRVTITYHDGRGVLRDLLQACTRNAWTVSSVSVLDRQLTPIDGGVVEGSMDEPRLVAVGLVLNGRGAVGSVAALGSIDGVVRVDVSEEQDD